MSSLVFQTYWLPHCNVDELSPQGRDHECKQKRDTGDRNVRSELPSQFFHLSTTLGHAGDTLEYTLLD